MEKVTDVGVQAEPVGSGKPESLLELDPAQANMLDPAQANMLDPAQANMLDPAKANMLDPAQANMLDPAQANMPLTSYQMLQTALQRFEHTSNNL